MEKKLRLSSEVNISLRLMYIYILNVNADFYKHFEEL